MLSVLFTGIGMLVGYSAARLDNKGKHTQAVLVLLLFTIAVLAYFIYGVASVFFT